MIFKWNTIFKIITTFVVISGAMLIDDSRQESMDYYYTRDACDKGFRDLCREQIYEAVCQDINVPINQTVEETCCGDLCGFIGKNCFFNKSVGHDLKGLKLCEPFYKNTSMIDVRAIQVFDYCSNLLSQYGDCTE